jgi:hypothetical protein
MFRSREGVWLFDQRVSISARSKSGRAKVGAGSELRSAEVWRWEGQVGFGVRVMREVARNWRRRASSSASSGSPRGQVSSVWAAATCRRCR